MSKTEKKILEAKEWRQKHAGDAAGAPLDHALAAWESTRDRETALKADLKTAKEATASAVKTVGKTLKEIKALRKSAKAAPAEKPVSPLPKATKAEKKAPKPPVQG
jgi:hypothetical protein